MEAYNENNEEHAEANASRLIRNEKVRQELDNRVEKEIDINAIIQTLDRKLKNHSETPKLSREELAGIRLALECAGKIGGKGMNVNLFQNLSPSEACPHCGRKAIFADFISLDGVKPGTMDYLKLPAEKKFAYRLKQIEAREASKQLPPANGEATQS